MAIRPDKSKSATAAVDGPSHHAKTCSYWFLISDSGRAFLRARPGLHIGESENGLLAVSDRVSGDHWLCFRSDDQHMWLETTSNKVWMSSDQGEQLEQQPLLPGLVLAFPNNRLVVSQDGLFCPSAGTRLSVQYHSLDGSERNAIEAHEVNTPAHDPSAELIGRPLDRYGLGRIVGILSAIVLLASPFILDQLTIASSTPRGIGPTPAKTIEPLTVETPKKAVQPAMLPVEMREESYDSVESTVLKAESFEAAVPPSLLPLSLEGSADQGTSDHTETVIEETAIAASTLFAFDSAELSDNTKRVIDERLIAITDADPSASILRIEGHTDSTGPEVYNLYLSRLRAEAVADYLASQGYFEDAVSIEALGKGELEPAVPNDTREGRMANRRVVIVTERMISR